MKLFSSKSKRHQARHTGRHCRAGRASRAVLPLCLALLLLTGITVGGTLAFMQEDSGAVTNSFKAGKINYTLKLEPNASNANAKYQDTEVIMPTALDAQEDTNLSVTFTPNKEPALTGYTFSGWYYNAACTEEYPHVSGLDITVKYGDSHDLDSDANKVEITLYAKWTANQYTVAYDGNGATAGSMEPSTHTYDVAANLTKNAYSRTGYRFLGWSTNASASAATYTDEQQVSNLTPVNGATVQLYAIWERMDFTVTFDTQAAGVTANPASKTVTYQMAYEELPDLTRTGYTFDGWALEKTGETEITSASIVGLAEDHTLYAQWTPYTYTVKYENNVNPDDTSITQPTGSTADSTHTYDVEKPLTENGFDRTGYTFIGWNTQPDGKGTSYGNGESVINLTSV